jgi:NAD(P)-dependent dehydrogenase (short-subunit alcohol dehydrogenase family)
MSRGLRDRVVVVIGGHGGIGGAIVRRLAGRGARVGLADLEIGPAGVADGAAHRWRTDVRDPASLARLRDAALDAFGTVDAVINCAAVIRPAAAGSLLAEEVREEIETNLLGAVLVAGTFVPVFRARGRGHVVLFASLGGVVPMPGGSVYAATKFGVRGFGLSLALELRGTGVDVSVVSPDSTDTPMLRAEALGRGSPMSFTSAPLSCETVAAAVERILRRPRLEVLVPPARGLAGRLIAFSPATLAVLVPPLLRLGRRGRDRYCRMLALTREAP